MRNLALVPPLPRQTGLPEDLASMWVAVPKVADPRGSLCFMEGQKHVPFEMKRIFYLYDVGGAARGSHAHRALIQMFIPLGGRFMLHLDDGHQKVSLEMNDPARALVVPPMVWAELDGFTPGTTCLVVASDIYDEADYIRDYETFLKESGHA
jgi:hypothetical protein